MAVAAAAAMMLCAQNGPMDKILLKDYQPDSSLVVPVTNLVKARFPVIDAHSHPYTFTPDGVKRWVEVMDRAGVETTVVLTMVTGAKFDKLVELYLKPYPKRFRLYCGLETKDIEAPDYPARAVAELERCYRMGARGVGELVDKGSGLQHGPKLPRAKRLHPDDPRLDAFWKKCAELRIPVNLHVADHPSAWRPPDAHQERSVEYAEYNQYGHDVPSYEEMLEYRVKVIARHPETRFVLCHLGNQGNDLAALGRVLDRNPRMYLDLSARAYEIGRQPRFAAQFLAKYKDRIVFGTDQRNEPEMYTAWWRVLETTDEYMPSDTGWRLFGLNLPDEVLKPLYYDNAKRLLNWE